MADADNTPTIGLGNLEAATLEKEGITFVNAADFLAQELPPPNWIIPDLISVGMKCDLIAKSKTRKTFMALQLANCVATGKDFLKWSIPRPRKVAYVNLEIMEWFMQERLNGQTAGLQVDKEALRNLTLVNIRGKGQLLREKADAVRKHLVDLGVEFVIIDPQYKLLGPEEDENSGAGMQGILEFRDRLADHFAVLLVAHDTKGAVGFKNITDRGAGTGFLGRDFDFRFVLTLHADGDKDHIVMSVANRNRPSDDDFTCVFDSATRLFTPDFSIFPSQETPLTVMSNRSRREKVNNNAEIAEAFKRDALAVAEEAGDNLLGKETFRARLGETDSGALAINTRKSLLKSLIETGELKEQRELERGENGTVKYKYHGSTFLSTPERIDAYNRKFERLPLDD